MTVFTMSSFIKIPTTVRFLIPDHTINTCTTLSYLYKSFDINIQTIEV